jgi:hypothetical protein
MKDGGNMVNFENDNYSLHSRFKGNSLSSRNQVLPINYVNKIKETARTVDNDYGMNKNTTLGP